MRIRASIALAVSALALAAGVTPAPAGAAPALVASAGPYLIYNTVTGKCVDLPNYGAGTVNGPVAEYTCNGTSGDNQLFYFNPDGTGYYTISNAKDGLCLDVPNYGAVGTGTLVSEYYCNNSTADNQQYWLYQRDDGSVWIVNRLSPDPPA